MTPKNYADKFFSAHHDASLRSARAVLPVVREYVQPDSVVDVGCGGGTWLAAWKELGTSVVLGMDGAYVAGGDRVIDEREFLAVDLEIVIPVDRRYDLATCLEVAEHITPPNARRFVGSLCALSDLVLFSAAIPGQGGTLHVNEQFPGYWQEIFREFGFVASDCLRRRLWNDDRIAWWYRQNLLFYVRSDRVVEYPGLTVEPGPVLSLVHPELFQLKCRRVEVAEDALGSPASALWHFLKRYLRPLRACFRK